MMIRFNCTKIALIICHAVCFSQVKIDSSNMVIGLGSTFSSASYQPLWITANNWGKYQDRSDNLVQTALFQMNSSPGKNVSLEAGIESIIRNSARYEFDYATKEAWLNQYYLNFSIAAFTLKIGAEAETLGDLTDQLGSGGFEISGNANPIPRISLEIPHYEDVPYTKGFIQVKGGLAHGWLERDRYVSKPFLHQKYGFIKIAADRKINFEAGIIHHALWGGYSPKNGAKYPSNPDAWWRVFSGKPARQGSTAPLGDIAFRYGSHRGSANFILNFDFGPSWSLQLYTLQPWEDYDQIGLPLLKYIRNRDGINGFNLASPSKLLANLSFEYIHTVHQGGKAPGDPPLGFTYADDPDGCRFSHCHQYGGRNNHYNNGAYASGWTYYERIIGIPLFIHKDKILNLLSDEEIGDVATRLSEVYNNRIRAIHLGLRGAFSDRFSYQMKLTYTKNFGNYHSEYGEGFNDELTGWPRYGLPYYFREGITQFYSAITLYHQAKKIPLETGLSLGMDRGKIINATGLKLEMNYRLFKQFANQQAD